MSANVLRVAGTGLFFLLIFLSGIWLSRSGKPYHMIILNVHKLISLAAVVFLVITTYRMHQAANLGAMGLTAGVVTGLLFVGTIITGGLLSTGKPMPGAILAMHRITPVLTVLSTAATLYLY
jgi:hypothetical protein